jgi:hypothetical protein
MTRQRWSWVLASLIGLAAFGVVFWQVPSRLYLYVDEPKDRAAVEASTRTGMIAGLVGQAALGSLAISVRTYLLTQQGQITDRYTKAIEQLGSDKLDVRLGGIYALESIAHDSEKDQDYREHRTVVEVLSAYVREHSDPAHTDLEPSIAKVLSTFLQGDNERAGEQPLDVGQFNRKLNPTTDVRAALTVLGRLPFRQGVARADLLNVHLVGAHLKGTNLSGFGLVEAHLRETDLQGAHLQEADLREADLGGANLRGAKLEEAKMQGANLGGANLRGANLREAHLERANLREAYLEEADLQQADLRGAHLEGVDLTSVRGLIPAQLQVALVDLETRLPAKWHEANGTDTQDSAQF